MIVEAQIRLTMVWKSRRLPETELLPSGAPSIAPTYVEIIHGHGDKNAVSPGLLVKEIVSDRCLSSCMILQFDIS